MLVDQDKGLQLVVKQDTCQKVLAFAEGLGCDRARALVLRVCKRAGAHEQPRHVQATVVRRKFPTMQRETRLAA